MASCVLRRHLMSCGATCVLMSAECPRNVAAHKALFYVQSQKEGINVSGIEEDLQAATDKYNKARQHVRVCLPCLV